MKAVLAILVVLLIIPEFPRHASERRLQVLSGMMNLAAREPHILRRISADAERLRTWPGDWRPLNAAASASLLAGDSDRAIALFEEALQQGERPEILANLGFALFDRGDARATAVLQRASQISPAVIEYLKRQRARRLRARNAASGASRRSREP